MSEGMKMTKKTRKLPEFPEGRDGIGNFLRSSPRWALRKYYEKFGRQLFYLDRGDPREARFMPAYLSSYLKKRYRIVVFVDPRGKTVGIFRYDWKRKLYRADGKRFLQEKMREIFGDDYTIKLVTQTFADLKALPGQRVSEDLAKSLPSTSTISRLEMEHIVQEEE